MFVGILVFVWFVKLAINDSPHFVWLLQEDVDALAAPGVVAKGALQFGQVFRVVEVGFVHFTVLLGDREQTDWRRCVDGRQLRQVRCWSGGTRA